MPVYPQSLSFRDAKGKTSWLRLFISAVDSATAASEFNTFWRVQFAACSNAANVNWTGPATRTVQPVSYGGTGKFEDCEDKLRVFCQTGAGSSHLLDIPAPAMGLFLTDGETVNMADSRMVAIVTAITAHGMCDRDGNLFTQVIGGVRTRVVLRRKNGLYLKNPQLTTTNL